MKLREEHRQKNKANQTIHAAGIYYCRLRLILYFDQAKPETLERAFERLVERRGNYEQQHLKMKE